MEIFLGIVVLFLALSLVGIAIEIIKAVVVTVVKVAIGFFIFALITSVVFYVLAPILTKTIPFSKEGMWIAAVVTGITLLYMVWSRQETNFRKYGTLAVLLNFLITTLPLWLLNKTSYEGIQSLQLLLEIEPMTLEAISINAIFTTCWISINLSTFIFYALDKLIAIVIPSNKKQYAELSGIQRLVFNISRTIPFIKLPSRIPEDILHYHSYFGGSGGAFAARYALNHKSTKEPFSSIFRKTVLYQSLSLGAIFLANTFISGN